MTINHFIILGLALCIVLTVVGFMPLEDKAIRLHGGSNKVLPTPKRMSPGEPARHWEWGDGAYEFKTLWYEIVY